MLRVALVLSLTCAVIALPAVPSVCVEQCDDDGADERCTTECVDCVCCLNHVQLAASSVVAREWPCSELTRVIGPQLRAPASPEPDDILHVPIATHS